MPQRFQRLAAAWAAIVVALPLSLFAETRRPPRTDLEELASELERVLGPGKVEIGRPSGPREDASVRRGQSAGPGLMQAAEDRIILDAMNRERAARGLRPLRLNGRLSLAAMDRAGDMFRHRYFDHVAPDGTEPFVWMTRRGYRYRAAGENLAVGYRGSGVVSGWMRSPGHRANVLGAEFDEVGLAVVPGSPTRGYRGPTVVALYGSR